MAKRAGSADLPLHGGKVPRWLGDRMTRLGAVITEAIVHRFSRLAHAAIEGRDQGEIVNLADTRAKPSREGQLDLLATPGPDRILRELALIEKAPAISVKEGDAQLPLPHLVMPAHHDVRESDINMRRLHGNFAAAAERGAADFEGLLLTPGVDARAVQALALVAEVVHGAPCRFSDPARFSLARGGRDRHPFPVPLNVYEETIGVMKSAVRKARLGVKEGLQALKQHGEQSRQLERYVTGPDLKEIVAGEFRCSAAIDGRSVFGWERDLRKPNSDD
ncbi:DUF763 domain-containing protein [Shinella zoogloeoides]